MTDWSLFKLNEMKFKKKFSQSLEESLIYPCGWQKVLIKEDEKGDVYIDTQRVDYFDVWTDFAYRDELQEAFHRIESNFNKLKALEKKGTYENVEDIIDPQKGGEAGVYPTDIPERKAEVESLFLSLADYGVDAQAEEKEARSQNKVELIEWWGKYDINDDGYDEKIIVTIANRVTGIRIDSYEERVPFFPIRIGKSSRVIYGRPLPQQLEMLQEELNEQRSKRYDLLDRLLNLMFKVRRTAQIDWDNLFSAPNNVLLMDDIREDLDVLEQRPLPASVYQEEQITKTDFEFVSGARDLGGFGTSGTATGINAILSESATRFRNLVEDIVDDMLDLVNYIFLQIKKYSEKKETIKIFGTDRWTTISPKELKGDYRIDIGISNITTPNKEMRIQLLINLLNIVGRLQGMVDIKEFIRMILTYADIKDVDNIMGSQRKKERGIISRLREKIAGKKREQQPETGLEGVIGRITAPQVLETVAPSAPQTVVNPMIDIIAGMQGGGVPGGGQQGGGLGGAI
jgi:hypothetical protein